jgi:hypothetical protein
MGKDRTGTFHPGKGKPSGINKEEGLGIQPTDPDKMEEYFAITDKYMEGDDKLAANVHLRHPNRNTSKGEDTYKAKENTDESDKTKNDEFNREVATTPIEELPTILTKELFAEIAAYRSSCCISIYCNTHAAGIEVNEGFDVITFKNILQQLASELAAKDVSQTTIEKLLKPGFELMRDDEFWLNLSPGLALFIAEDYFKFIKMPVATENDVVCESTFFVSPLIPIIASPEYYYLLVISKQRIKLFRGNKFELEFISVPELPSDISQVTGTQEKSSSLWRTGGRGGKGGANFHGAGGEFDHKTDIAAYFEAVDDILFKKILNKENAPLLLAGVEYEIPIYRSVCDYHNVWNEALTGNYEHHAASALHEEAKEVMAPYFNERKNKAKELFANKIATALTASMPEMVIPASYYGKVSHLFVRKGAHVWGTFDEMKNELIIHQQEESNSEDLIDNAVEKTFLNGGEVFLVDAEEMPSDGEIAAVFRY